MHELVQASRAHQKCRDHLPWIQVVVSIGYDPLLAEVDHAIREHLGMNAKVMFVAKTVEYRVGDRANSQLQHGAIGYETGNMFANALFHASCFRGRNFNGQIAGLYQGIDF